MLNKEDRFMLDFEQLKLLNERSMTFNGPMKAIYIKEITCEDMPYVSYRLVNTKSKADYSMTVLSFLAKLIAMEIYVVNIENINISEFFECYDIVGAELTVRAGYCDGTGLLSVYVFDALLSTFLPYELMEENAVDILTKRVLEACKKHWIPLGEHSEDIVRTEIRRCIEEEINSRRPMKIDEMGLDKWFAPEEKLFNEE